MNLLQGKNAFFNFLAIAVITIGAAYVITSDGFSAKVEQVRFSELSDADIDMILAVKNEMHEAQIRAN
jgi:predicted double-glycine peptidase